MYRSAKLFNEMLSFSMGLNVDVIPEAEMVGMPQMYREAMFAHQISADALRSRFGETILGFLDLLEEDAKTLTDDELGEAMNSYRTELYIPREWVTPDLPGFSAWKAYEGEVNKPGRRNRENRTKLYMHARGCVPHTHRDEVYGVDRRTEDLHKLVQGHRFSRRLDQSSAVTSRSRRIFNKEIQDILFVDFMSYIPMLPWLPDKRAWDTTMTYRTVLNIMKPTLVLAKAVTDAKQASAVTVS
jgi:hypothetical protein